MKQSHYVTPRSLSQAHFALDADPIESFGPDRRYASVAIAVFLVLGAIAAVAFAALS